MRLERSASFDGNNTVQSCVVLSHAGSGCDGRNFNQAKLVADIIVQPVLFNAGTIVPIAETVGKLVDRAVAEPRSVTLNQSHDSCGSIVS